MSMCDMCASGNSISDLQEQVDAWQQQVNYAKMHLAQDEAELKSAKDSLRRRLEHK